MATKFVYSAAAGTNDGSSWVNAWTSAASSNGVAAGDIVKVEYRHTETALAANINWSNGTAKNPVRVISCDSGNSDALRVGGNIGWGTTAKGPQGAIYSYGINWSQSGNALDLVPGTDLFQTHESGTFTVTGATGITIGGSRGGLRFLNQNVDFSGASNASVVMSGPDIHWLGGTYTCRSTQTNLFTVGPMRCVGVTFSGTVTNISGLSGGGWANTRTVFERCVGPTFTNLPTMADMVTEGFFDLNGTGTITVAALPPAYFQTAFGQLSPDLTRYRTGGAADGSQANAYSWAMVSNANAGVLTTPLISPPVTRWVSAGAQTVTLYVASGGSLNNDDIWVEVVSPSEAGSATALPKINSARCAPLAANAALTTDGTSTWTGTGVGTKQKIAVSITPTIPGPVSVRFCLAKTSGTVYVDPRMDVA